VSMIKFVGTNAVPKLDHGRAWLLRPDGAGKTLTLASSYVAVILRCTATNGNAAVRRSSGAHGALDNMR
jgi:hypothetical protein